MKKIITSNYMVLTVLITSSCVGKIKYEQLQSSKDRLTRTLANTTNELESIRERTFILSEKFENESLKINSIYSKIKTLEESVRKDSLELIRYKSFLNEYKDKYSRCEENTRELTSQFESHIKALNASYIAKMRIYASKLKREKWLRAQYEAKLEQIQKSNLIK